MVSETCVFCIDALLNSEQSRRNANLWEDDIEGTRDEPMAVKISIYIVESLLVIWISGIEVSLRVNSVGKLRDSSAYKAVVIE